ncbi:hypothetical protein VKT23_016579 [Stygiomarasmius scandens]|uniref:Uncharacterized protein n=1 Tax=Marasmiellus scandens TaxID=2682957 RepID=A0ABR1IXS1_9AGAR
MACGRRSQRKQPDPISAGFDMFENAVERNDSLALAALEYFTDPAKTYRRYDNLFAWQVGRYVINTSTKPHDFTIDLLIRRFNHWADDKPNLNPRGLGRILGAKENGDTLQNVFANIPVKIVKPLLFPFPPRGTWITESQEAYKVWGKHQKERKMADKRVKQKPVVLIDPKTIPHNVKTNESAVFRNENGTLVMAIVRNACPFPELVESVDATVTKCTSSCRDVRMDDPGILSLVGMCPGNRSSPQFDWARNFTRPDLTDDDISSLRYEQASIFALFWNLVRNIFPSEIIGTFDEFIKSNNLVRMDDGIFSGGGGADMAPPSGVCASNYARYVHFEKSPHPFAIAWTTSHTGNVNDGGHFYNAKYGIRVEAAANTIFVWRPEHAHATSLMCVDPEDPDPSVTQRGLSIVTSNRLVNAFKNANPNDYTPERLLQEGIEWLVNDLTRPMVKARVVGRRSKIATRIVKVRKKEKRARILDSDDESPWAKRLRVRKTSNHSM